MYAKDQPRGFSNRIEKVAIVGAGGHMGVHLTEHLLQTGKHVITAIARPGSTHPLPENVRVVRVDYGEDDQSTLVEALRGQQVLIVTMSIHAPRDTVGKLVRAAAKAGVPYVLPNWFGHDANNKPLCDDSMVSHMGESIRSEIAKLGVSSYLQLVCNFWYEFSLGGGPDRFGFDFRKRSFVAFDDGNVPINVSTWAQCGRAIANLLSLKEFPDDKTDQSPTLSQFRNHSIYISSFLVSQRDMFESVKRVTNTTEADWTITNESAEQRWKDSQAAVQLGNFKEFTKMLYSRMFLPTGDGDYQTSRGLDNDLLHLPVEDLDESTAVGVRMGEKNEVVYGH